MSQETEFVNGLIVKAPHERAPEYVKAKLSIRREELIAWLQTKPDDWINVEVKESRNGKWYAAVDGWKPESGGSSGSARGGAPNRQRPAPMTGNAVDDEFGDSIPFCTSRSAW